MKAIRSIFSSQGEWNTQAILKPLPLRKLINFRNVFGVLSPWNSFNFEKMRHSLLNTTLLSFVNHFCTEVNHIHYLLNVCFVLTRKALQTQSCGLFGMWQLKWTYQFHCLPLLKHFYAEVIFRWPPLQSPIFDSIKQNVNWFALNLAGHQKPSQRNYSNVTWNRIVLMET